MTSEVYEEIIEYIVYVVEAMGAAIMVVGGFVSLLLFAIASLKSETRKGSYEKLRQHLGQSILLGLEVLIVGDIVRTIIVDPTMESVGVLGAIVVIRIILSFSLEVEMDGTWPWNRWKHLKHLEESSHPQLHENSSLIKSYSQ